MEEFNASRGEVMFYLALGVVGQNLLAPIVGRILTRVVPWIVMLAGAGVTSAGLLVCSIAPSLIAVAVALFVTVAIGCCLSGLVASSAPLPSQAIFARQFPRIMGRAVAAQGLLISVMSISMPIVFAPVITEHGWRFTLAATGIAVIVYMPAVILLFLRKAAPIASSKSQVVDAVQSHSTINPLAVPTTRQIMASPNFWLLLLALEPLALVVGGIAPNLVPLYHDRGVSLDEAKFALSTLAASSGLGALLAGFVVDRIGPWIYLVVLSAFSFLAMVALSLNVSDPLIPLVILIVSVSGVGATLIVAISRLFGTSAFAPVMGLLTPFMMGSAFAGAFAGWMRDQLGNYQVVFGIMAGLLVIAVVAALILFFTKRAGNDVGRACVQAR